MVEIIKNGDIEKAKVSFTCPACGTEFTELPKYLEAEHIDRISHEIVLYGYLFQTECPTCGLPLREMKLFDNAAPEGGA